MLSYVGGFKQGYAGTTADIVVPLTTLTGGTDSAPSADDIVVVCFSNAYNNLLARVIAGYTTIATLRANDTYDTNLTAGYKIMGVTPDSSVTLTGGTGSSSASGVVEIHVWRGVDLITPIDVTTTTVNIGNSALPTPPPITPITPGAIILAGAGNAHIGGAVPVFGASYLSNFITVGANDTYDATGGLGSVAWLSGAYTPAQWTWSGTNSTGYCSSSFTTALRPAVPGVLAVGSEGQGAIGTVSIVVTALIPVVGVAGTGAVGTVRIAGWTNVNDAQTPNWGTIITTGGDILLEDGGLILLEGGDHILLDSSQTPNWVNITTT